MKPMQHCWDIVFESASEIFDGHKTHSGLCVVIGVQNGTVVHLGAVQPDRIGPQTDRIDCSGMIITPGLIDCHTHLVF